MKSFELAVNIERVIRSLKNTWTIIKPAWGAPRTSRSGKGGGNATAARGRRSNDAEARRRKGVVEEGGFTGTVEKIFFRLFFVTMARKDTWSDFN